MSFNKRKHLETNIEAIKIAFELENSQLQATTEQHEILRKYCGFGGLKCILLPCEKSKDVHKWNKTDAPLFPLVRQLHQVLRDYTNDELWYNQYVDSLKKSILTAFYTPPEIAQAIAEHLENSNIIAERFLDPSAGNGVFIDAFKDTGTKENVCFENDLITGKILSALYPDDTLHIAGFETMQKSYNGYFDVVSSNIPFGNFSVFDPAFVDSKDEVKRRSVQSIHGYFFLKAMDALREGGIMAFITSRFFMDGRSSRDEREWLMQRSKLISAIRLPDNLFAETANTQAQTDLIILQKNSGKMATTELEEAFIQTAKLAAEHHVNKYFIEHEDNTVQTKSFFGTNQYGKPSIEYFHDGTMEDIANELTAILKRDFSENYDWLLYHKKNIPNVAAVPKKKRETGLFDLFGLSETEKTGINSIKAQMASSTPVLLAERPFSSEKRVYFKEDMIVTDKGQIGRLSGIKNGTAYFKPITLPFNHLKIIKDYLPLRNTYLDLSLLENTEKSEQPEYRRQLKEQYQFFVGKYGELNSKNNVSVIKLDCFGAEVLSLEGYAIEKTDERIDYVKAHCMQNGFF